MKVFGPSTLISAAFIGPGTITVCTMAGVNHGYDLLFALLFSTIATIILQEMAARLGIVNKSGLGKPIRGQVKKGFGFKLMFALVVLAIILGNSAYEAGNISGSTIGLELVLGEVKISPLFIGMFAFAILYFGSYQLIEKALIVMVMAMSVAFVVTVFLIKPDFKSILTGLVPSISSNLDWKVLIALIGTTVVPYNLFLHSSIVSKRYSKAADISEMRVENAFSISLGGLVSMLIVIVAANSHGLHTIKSPSDLAVQLQPLLGKWANWGIGIGLFAAGLSSAITAPLAAGLVAKELFNWDEKEQGKYRLVWIVVLGTGIIFSSLGIKPLLVIQFAQMLNGILLPIIAIYLLILVNKSEILKEYVNSTIQNVLGILVILISILISFKTIFSLLS